MAMCWNIARLRSNPRPNTHQETDIAAFREAFTERARSARASLAEGQAKRRRTGARQVLPDGDITQAEAKTMLPPNTSIWRDRTRQGWCVHPSGHSRLSSLWASSGGEQQALCSVLRKCWALHVEGEGRGIEECPIEGLFTVGGRSAGGVGGSSSSSSCRAAPSG